MNYAISVAEACERADTVTVLTEWPEFVDLGPIDLQGVVRARFVIDGRSAFGGRSAAAL